MKKSNKPLEIITIQEYDSDRHKCFGEKNTAPPKYEINSTTKNTDGDTSGQFTSYAYSEIQIFHGLALALEIARNTQVEVDFKLDKNYDSLKQTINVMVRDHNYFINELEKKNTSLDLFISKSK